MGGGVRIDAGVSDSFNGVPSTRIAPTIGCSSSAIIVARGDLRIGKQLVEIAHRSARDPGSREPLDPVRARLGAEPRRHERPQLVVGEDALPVGGEPLVLGDSRHGTEAAPLIVVADRQHELAVGRAKVS